MTQHAPGPMSSCPLCDRVNTPDHPTLIRAFEHGVAFVNPEQDDFPGYAVLALKHHHEQMHRLPPAVLHGFMDERARLAAAILRAYPEVRRINYANLGNMVPHLHEHLIPRRPGDHNDGAAPWPLGSMRPAEDEHLRAVARKLAAALD
jgi:diadenosine tetraphosphate (Ap4A) HIT family hydrolase